MRRRVGKGIGTSMLQPKAVAGGVNENRAHRCEHSNDPGRNSSQNDFLSVIKAKSERWQKVCIAVIFDPYSAGTSAVARLVTSCWWQCSTSVHLFPKFRHPQVIPKNCLLFGYDDLHFFHVNGQPNRQEKTDQSDGALYICWDPYI